MTLELFIGLFVFAGIAAFTPGPNNALLMASGMNFGFRRSVPLIFGVALGFPLMIGLIGLVTLGLWACDDAGSCNRCVPRSNALSAAVLIETCLASKKGLGLPYETRIDYVI